MNNLFIFALSCFTTAVLSFILGIFIITRDYKRSLYKSVFLFYLSVFVWTLGLGLEVISTDKSVALFWSRFLHTGVIFLAPSFLYFISTYVKRLEQNLKFIIFLYFIAGIFFICNLLGFIVPDVSPKFYFNYYTEPGFLYWYLLGFFIFCVGYSFYELFQDLKNANSIRKNQILYLLLSTSIGYTAGSETYLPVFNLSVPSFSMFVVAIYPFVAIYSILSYRLPGVKLVMGRIINPILSTIITLLIIILSSKTLSMDVHPIIYTIFIISIFYLVYMIIFKITQHMVSDKNYDELLLEHIENLIASTSKEEVLGFTMDVLKDKNSPQPSNVNIFIESSLKEGLPIYKKVKFIKNEKEGRDIALNSHLVQISKSFQLNNENRMEKYPIFIKDTLEALYSDVEAKTLRIELEDLDVEICLPLLIKTKEENAMLVGFLCLGESEVSDIYESQDYDFFKKIAHQTGQATVQVEARNLIEKENMQAYQHGYQQHLIDTIKRLSETRNINDFSQEVMSVLQREADVQYASIYIYNIDKQEFDQKGMSGNNGVSIPRSIKESDPLIHILNQHQKPIELEQIEIWAESKSKDMLKALNMAKKLHGLMFSPIASDKILGIIVLGDKKEDKKYALSEWNILHIVSDFAAMAIQSMLFAEDMVKDKLTRVYNQGYTPMLIQNSMLEAMQTGEPTSLLFTDIDNFKSWNDKFGHEKGNDVLKFLTLCMRETARPSDILGRYGGEEFIIILPKTDKEGAEIFANRFLENLRQHPHNPGHVTISAGISTFIPNKKKEETKESEETVIHDMGKLTKKFVDIADKAMYIAKKQGKNRYIYGRALKIGEGLEAFIVADNKKDKDLASLKTYFKQEGYKTTVFSDLETISASLDKTVPVSIIIYADLLKDIDIEKFIQKLKEKNTVPIAVISSNAELKAKLASLDIERFFLQPVKISEIEDWVKRLN
ncbi:MAG: diguanylate cyclase [bacterium]|nr:diguanylate cyclase [bacterium]